MKRLSFLILLVLLISTEYSQVSPSGFKLQVQLPQGNNSQFNNLIQPWIAKKLDVTPNTSNLPLSNFVSDITVVGDTIWFATGKGVSRTYNNGVSFDNFYTLDPFGKDDIPGLTVYKNFVVVSTATTTSKNGQNDIPTGTGIKVSTDYGHNWVSYPQPKDTRGVQEDSLIFYGPVATQDTIHCLKVTVDQDNLTYSILVTRKNLTSDSIVIWIASWAGEVRKSTDYGATFFKVLLPPDSFDSISYFHAGHYNFSYNPRDPSDGGNDNHKGFSLAAENDSTIYVGTAHGINKSTDWGLSWKNYTTTRTAGRISGNFVVSLGIQRYGFNQIVWAASNIGSTNHETIQQSSGVSYSTNSGLQWSSSLTDNAVFTHSMGFMDSIVYACTDNGIWRSIFSPNNLTWATPYIIYDTALRDQLKTNSFYAASSSILGDTNFIWVGSGDGMARTKETGSPWTNPWKIFRAHKDVVSSSETYAAPNPFQPKNEFTRIFYKTGKPSANVTIKIFDFGMNFVRALIQNAPRNGTDIQYTAWDGTRDDGKQVANGVYFYRVQVDNSTVAWGKILVLQ